MAKVRYKWLLLFLLPYRVDAHPHAFIDMQSEFLVRDNQLVGIKMNWLFDAPSSAEMLYNLKIANNREQMRTQLADEIMQNIIEQHYFSYFYDQHKQPLRYTSKPDNYVLQVAGDQLRFSFDFYLSKPQPLAGFQGSLSTYDPSYYVAMSYPDPVKGSLPGYPQCKISVYTPKINDLLKNYAKSLDKNQQYEDLTLGMQFAQQVNLLCQ